VDNQKPANSALWHRGEGARLLQCGIEQRAVKPAYLCRTTRKRQSIVADLDGMLT